jgi:hypothetical protein
MPGDLAAMRRVLVATWVLAVATAILAISGPSRRSHGSAPRKQDRERLSYWAAGRYQAAIGPAGAVTVGMAAAASAMAWQPSGPV